MGCPMPCGEESILAGGKDQSCGGQKVRIHQKPDVVGDGRGEAHPTRVEVRWRAKPRSLTSDRESRASV